MLRKASLLALVLAFVLLLGACGETAAPQETPQAAEQSAESETPAPTPEPTPSGENAIVVTSVDELLAAIAPGHNVWLAEGTYDLSTASDYGTAYDYGYYSWIDSYDGYGLVIRGAKNLSLSALGEVTVSAVPRYADVLGFDRCTGLSLTGLKLGHSTEPGICAGGVLDFESCQDVLIRDCGLYGCGVMGISAIDCSGLTAEGCCIYECSYGAVSAGLCRDVRLIGCEICDNGLKDDYSVFALLQAQSCEGFALVNCSVHDNHCQQLIRSEYSRGSCLLGCDIRGNRISDSLFALFGRPVTVDKCGFYNPRSAGYYNSGDKGLYAVDPNGEDLISFDLDRMEREPAEYDGPESPEAVQVVGSPQPDGVTEYRVSSVDELIAAIGSNTRIILEEGDYNFSTASVYGSFGGEHYRWVNYYDGPGLVITGVENFTLCGAGPEKTRILATPRYVCVLEFEDCRELTLSGLTAGHTPGGVCGGDVLSFQRCEGVNIADCGLFGCGVWGIRAWQTRTIRVTDTDIYECSDGGVMLEQSADAVFTGCRIHDCRDGCDLLWSVDSGFTFDGVSLEQGPYLMAEGRLWEICYDESGNLLYGAARDNWLKTHSDAVG